MSRLWYIHVLVNMAHHRTISPSVLPANGKARLHNWGFHSALATSAPVVNAHDMPFNSFRANVTHTKPAKARKFKTHAKKKERRAKKKKHWKINDETPIIYTSGAFRGNYIVQRSKVPRLSKAPGCKVYEVLHSTKWVVWQQHRRGQNTTFWGVSSIILTWTKSKHFLKWVNKTRSSCSRVTMVTNVHF